MEEFKITTGDFLKNAGIVGMKYMLDNSEAKEGQDYGVSDDNQSLWVGTEFAQNADWTDMYFKAFVSYFGPYTTYQRVLEKIENNLKKLESGEWTAEKAEKEDLKYINDKLLSNSYQAGYENIKQKIEKPEVYQKLQKEKLKDKLGTEELQLRLQELQIFIQQPVCKETFVMKSVIYTYVNRFWDGKCFLLRANAKKDMREVFENDFIKPLRSHWGKAHEKAKDLCIDCGIPMEAKEKVSIAFMKDIADDLTRKRSAFWDGKVDAFLCPVCAFVYALSPLGFQLLTNKFLFINVNDSVESLLEANSKIGAVIEKTEREENERLSSWFARVTNVLIQEKVKELSNVQIILRGTNAEDAYLFNVIHKDVLNILKEDSVKRALNRLSEHPFVKMGNEFLNVHEKVILNILQYRKQYALLNNLMRKAVDNDGLVQSAYLVYAVQVLTAAIQRGEKGGKILMSRITMRNSGYKLRRAILADKGTTKDDCLRGTIYQLVNALAVKNEEKFMDIVIRLYCSKSAAKLLMPDEFVYMLGGKEKDKDRFQEYGYAFVLGLKGSHPDSEKEEKKDE